MDENGHQNGEKRIKLGNWPGGNVPPEMAETMLMWLWEHEVEAARAALCHAMHLPIPSKQGRRKSQVEATK